MWTRRTCAAFRSTPSETMSPVPPRVALQWKGPEGRPDYLAILPKFFRCRFGRIAYLFLMTRDQFIRRLRQIARSRGETLTVVSRRGKGSHMRVSIGAKGTTVPDPRV